jgi:uncharacterized protein (TIGR02246 family)
MSDDAIRFEQFIRDYEDAFNSGDYARVASYWAEDAVSLPPMGDELRGRDALEEFYKQSFESLHPRLSDYQYECRFVDDHVIVWESWKVTMNPPNGEPATIPGNGMWVGKKDSDGIWRTFWCIARLKQTPE